MNRGRWSGCARVKQKSGNRQRPEGRRCKGRNVVHFRHLKRIGKQERVVRMIALSAGKGGGKTNKKAESDADKVSVYAKHKRLRGG